MDEEFPTSFAQDFTEASMTIESTGMPVFVVGWDVNIPINKCIFYPEFYLAAETGEVAYPLKNSVVSDTQTPITLTQLPIWGFKSGDNITVTHTNETNTVTFAIDCVCVLKHTVAKPDPSAKLMLKII